MREAFKRVWEAHLNRPDGARAGANERTREIVAWLEEISAQHPSETFADAASYLRSKYPEAFGEAGK